jgi:hypothetical protein
VALTQRASLIKISCAPSVVITKENHDVFSDVEKPHNIRSLTTDTLNKDPARLPSVGGLKSLTL